MTRYVYDDGTSDDTGYIIRAVAEDGRLLDEIEPLEIIAALEAADTGGPAAAEEWSEWLEHHGGPCPLPPETRVECDTGDGWRTLPGEGVSARCWNWALDGVPQAITRYRYRCLPGGWVERGDFVPPASLWKPGTPVRCEWTCGMPSRPVPGTIYPDDWDGITHIRLLPAEPAKATSSNGPAKAEMPEGFAIDKRGYLRMSDGFCIFGPQELASHGTATILAAVKAWCAAMGERG